MDLVRLNSGQMVSMRLFDGSLADYEAAVGLRNRIMPDEPSSVSIWRHWDTSRPIEKPITRWMAESTSGKLLGIIMFVEMLDVARQFHMTLLLDETHWQSDLGAVLLVAALEQLETWGASAVISSMLESEQDKMTLFRTHGFQQIMRSPISYLQVQSFDATPFQGVMAKVSENGIEMVQPPTGWQFDPYWQHFVHELDWLLMQDVPHFEARTQTPFERFIREEFEHPNFLPDGYVVAFEGSRPVGMSSLVMRGGQTKRLATAVTGVARAYRRRGIASALKIHSILWAQSIGAEVIMTSNEENNPMFLLNQQLGFEPQPASTEWRKQLK